MQPSDAGGDAIVTFKDAAVEWFVPQAAPGVAEAMEAAVQRKVVASGPVGGSITVNVMQPGHIVLPHRHDCDEVIYVLDGGIRLGGGLGDLGPNDAVIIRAETTYGFEVGDTGVRFLIIRQREGGMSMSLGK